MARSGVTFAEIGSAASSLRAQGLEPTVDRVRERLGTGSKSTIGPLLKQWREQQGEQVADDTLPADLLAAVRSMHERTQNAAEEKIEQARSELQDQLLRLQQELNQYQESFRNSELQNAALAAELLRTESERGALEEQSRAQQLKTAKIESQRDEAWSKIADLKTLYGDLKQEYRALRESHERYQQKTGDDRQQEREEYRLSTQHQQGQIQQLLEQLNRADSRYSEAQSAFKQQSAELDDRRSELRTLHERHSKLKFDMEAMLVRLKEMITTCDELQRHKADCQLRHAEMTSALAQARQETDHLLELGARTDRSHKEAAAQLKRLSEENKVLIRDNAILQGQLKQINLAQHLRPER